MLHVCLSLIANSCRRDWLLEHCLDIAVSSLAVQSHALDQISVELVRKQQDPVLVQCIAACSLIADE